MQPKKLDHIQALRALAVLMVAMLHYPGNFSFARGGYAGVDLFFVISGYIMVFSTRGSDGSLAYAKEFIVKRLFRIWPTYAVMTIIVFVMLHPISDLESSAVQKWVLASLVFFPIWDGAPVVKTGWTLPFEMYFYCIFAISMLAGRHRWKALAAIFVLTMMALPLLVRGQFAWLDAAAYAFGAHGFGSYLSMITHPIVWDFAIGVFCGRMARAIPSVRRPIWAALLASSVATLLWMLLYARPSHGLIWGLPFGALVLATGWIPFKPPRVAVLMGDISYSAYLVQIITVELFDRYFGAAIYHAPYLVFPYLATIIAISLVSRQLLERKLSDALRRWIFPRATQVGQANVPAMTDLTQ